MVRNYKRKTEDRWSNEDLLKALRLIKNSTMKINEAARAFGISRATLYRHFTKFQKNGETWDVTSFRTCGGNPILSRVEENVLELTIKDLRAQGFTVSSLDIKRICFEYCESNGIPNQFHSQKRMASDDWYYGFLKRHPDIRLPSRTFSQANTPVKKIVKKNGGNKNGGSDGAEAEIEGILLSTAAPGTETSPAKQADGSKETQENNLRSPVLIIPTRSGGGDMMETRVRNASRNKKKKSPTVGESQAEVEGQCSTIASAGAIRDSGKERVKKPLKRLERRGILKRRFRESEPGVSLDDGVMTEIIVMDTEEIGEGLEMNQEKQHEMEEEATQAIPETKGVVNSDEEILEETGDSEEGFVQLNLNDSDNSDSLEGDDLEEEELEEDCYEENLDDESNEMEGTN